MTSAPLSSPAKLGGNSTHLRGVLGLQVQWDPAQRVVPHHTSGWVLLFRLFSWALLRFLNCVFLNVQLHKGQMKMVRKAAQSVRPAPHGVGLVGTEGAEAPSAGGKNPLLSDDLLFRSHGPAPTGLPLTSFHHGLNHYISALP